MILNLLRLKKKHYRKVEKMNVFSLLSRFEKCFVFN
jgi:hypothetical protein